MTELVPDRRGPGADGLDVPPSDIARLAQLVADGKTTTGDARQVLDVLVAEGGQPDEMVEREGLAALEDDGGLAGSWPCDHEHPT